MAAQKGGDLREAVENIIKAAVDARRQRHAHEGRRLRARPHQRQADPFTRQRLTPDQARAFAAA